MTPNKIYQLLNQNRKNGSGSLNIQNHGDVAVVYLYDAIVDTDDEAQYWGGVSAETFVKELANIQANTIHLRINSPGGSIFAGRAMENALRNHSAKVIAFVDGLAASAASWVMMGANEIELSKGAFIMIHQAHSFAFGNADDLISQADVLQKLDNSIAQTYAERTGLDVAELLGMMQKETWLDAATAVEKGFADRINEGKTAQNRWNLSAYNHAPQLPEPESIEPDSEPIAPEPVEPVNEPAEPEPEPTNNIDRDALARAANVAILRIA